MFANNYVLIKFLKAKNFSLSFYMYKTVNADCICKKSVKDAMSII